MEKIQALALNGEIRSNNAQWVARDNEVAQMTDKLKRARLGVVVDEAQLKAELKAASPAARSQDAAEAPGFAPGFAPAVDWRSRNGNHVTPPKDQGNCGSCVSFCVTGLVESMASIERNQLLNLSEADLHFCSSHGANCGGWWPADALGQVNQRGIPDEAAFPYPAGLPGSAVCNTVPDRNQRAVKITNFGAIADVAQRKEHLTNVGPCSAVIQVFNDFFSYSSGVYSHVSGALAGLHCVLVIGYSEADHCWLCKNSWGTQWGDGGFFRIAYGQCGIDTDFPFHWARDVTLPGVIWSGWESLGGKLTSRPQAVSWAANRIDVVVRGDDSAVHHKWWDGTSWKGWESLGGFIHGAPAICSWASGRLDIFAVGVDHKLYHKWFQGGWSNWESLGGFLTSEPAAVSWGPNRIDVFARGGDSTLHHLWWDGAWHGWESLGGTLSSAPAVSSWAPGRLDVFSRATDCQLSHKWFSGGWSNWESLGGMITDAPAAESWGPNRIDVFAPGANFHMFHKAWNGSKWLDWVDLGGVLCSGVGVSSWAAGRLDTFVMATNSEMHHKWTV